MTEPNVVAADQSSLRFQAEALDRADPLASFRDEFHLPEGPDGRPQIYLAGNSLGLAPKAAREQLGIEFDRWAELGVAGHFTGQMDVGSGWAAYHEQLTEPMAAIVGGNPDEVVVMNSLTVNLHLLMVSFYRPTPARHKILIESHAFPSDHFAVESQIRQRGFDPATSLVTIRPRPGEETLRAADLLSVISDLGHELALVMLPGVQYYTGQVLPMADITSAAKAQGALVGFDLAHAVGNIELDLHDWGVDFGAWCTYKYLNSGPGGVGGVFVHRRHVADQSLPKLLGWWGTRPETRFEMATVFEPIPTVESWQLSCPPIWAMATLRASLEMFNRAGGMANLRAKTEKQLRYLDELLAATVGDRIEAITPKSLRERGCQVALRVTAAGHEGRDIYRKLLAEGVACDWREPDVIRVAPTPLYNSFVDIHRFVSVLDEVLG